MTINNNDTPDISRLNLNSTSLGKTQGTSRASAAYSSAPTSGTSPSATSGDDSISLSNSPNLVQQALSASDPSRTARVQELKALVASGQYLPDANEVSSALIDAHLQGA